MCVCRAKQNRGSCSDTESILGLLLLTSSGLAVQLKYLSGAEVHSMFSCSASFALGSSQGAVCMPWDSLGLQTRAQQWGGGGGHCES